MIEWVAYRERIEEALKSLIPSSPETLFKASRYAVLTPGKRIRPLLTLLTAEIFKKESVEEALFPACALELLHSYSLVHDDLPCMDDDDFRRGMPTVHKVYGEGVAVLVGDYLLTHSFETIAHHSSLSSDQKVSLIQALSQASSGHGMIGGQVVDLESSSDIHTLHEKKTAYLFRCALEFGGIVAQVSKEVMQLLRSFGMELGLLFQMVDDILDKDHPLGEEKARSRAQTLYQSCLHILEKIPATTTPLQKVTKFIFDAGQK